jgi:1,4-dihydroxy-2-naphthoyl-CoA hydrolase
MSIWFKKELNSEMLNGFSKNTMNDHIGIKFIEVGENYLKANMPVDQRTKQAYGLLHGGASATLAETVGSVASAMVIDPKQFICMGVEINANHLKSVSEGFVTATAVPLHLGSSSHVWEIKIMDQQENLICASRLTVYILRKKN